MQLSPLWFAAWSTGLSVACKLQLHGCFLQRGLIKQAAVEKAVRRIESHVQTSISEEEKDDLAINDRSFGGDALRESPDIYSLVQDSSLIPFVQQFFEKRICSLGSASVRVLPRFPAQGRKVVSPYHLDNIADRTIGGGMTTFAALIAIYLTDVQERPWRGNTVLYPPSHVLMSDKFRKHNWDAIYKLNGTYHRPDDLLTQEIQLQAHAGDVLLLHPLLLHGVAPNLGRETRHAVFLHLYFEDMLPPEHGGPPANDSSRLQVVQKLWHGWNMSLVQEPERAWGQVAAHSILPEYPES
mmetsp:Transcript_45837/g.102744  ORF Transcript_45837/g.102744 Transcript_45837/m.102744 type:complete len:297 (+) Transcript_45837:74-964(+)